MAYLALNRVDDAKKVLQQAEDRKITSSPIRRTAYLLAFLAADTEALGAIFKKVDQMNQPPVEKKLAETYDWTWPFCVVGLAFLGMALVASYGLREVPW